MGLSRERRGDDSPPTAIRLSPVPHHAIFEGFGAGVAKGDSGLIHRSLENGGFHDSHSATPHDVKAHIAWCGLLLYHTMRCEGSHFIVRPAEKPHNAIFVCFSSGVARRWL